MKKLLALVATGVAAAALAVPALAVTKSVTVGDDYFVRKGTPATVVVKKGDTVKWTWIGKHKHQVFQVGGPTDGKHLHSPGQSKGTWKHVFKKRGLYKFQCPYHAAMKMNVRVK